MIKTELIRVTKPEALKQKLDAIIEAGAVELQVIPTTHKGVLMAIYKLP